MAKMPILIMHDIYPERFQTKLGGGITAWKVKQTPEIRPRLQVYGLTESGCEEWSSNEWGQRTFIEMLRFQ